MDEQVDSTGRRRVVIASVVGVVVVLVVVVVVALLRAGASDAPAAADPSRTPAASAGGSSVTPTPTADASAAPSDAGPAPDGGAEGEGAGPAAAPGEVPVPPVSDVAPVVVETTGQARPAGGLSVAVTSVVATDVAGTGPGEYAGPGTVVVVRVVNEGADAVALATPAVSVYAGAQGLPVNPVLTDPANVLLPAEVGAGATVEGSYRFAQAPSGEPLAVTVLLSPGTAPIVAQGFRLG
ncbi:hypothetical protein [Cellulomonas wangsupingiae]|uniref:hypothetical protein n=1 Tax=Cellulomonas wangsupingiae TaxID=2968085 RepID=UPI001D0DD25F|nr:hypothetical protein [Cellulomonas wangsupingiae]MCM0640782.1 hypothetical protein [Cellulomonas wangsupingiae]